ncbi:CobW family GTP-binding protein [Lysinibacillus sp. NPDC098008]|uniref:CobW family GTP-binding protein n=1 Tax=Lysinibacillus sp. NPDC098008 TaxID=3364146 RepID=UPI0037FBD7B5
MDDSMLDKVEIVILSGFLGSGKTTLLQNLLVQERQRNRKVAVLMNEIGQVSIDRNLLNDHTPIEEIINGCICCTSKTQLENALLTLYVQEKPDVIYIEGSGIAHPMEIYDACLLPVIAQNIIVKSIITVVDGNIWSRKNKLSLRIQKLLEEQIRYADQIVINKVDLLTSGQYNQIVGDTKQLNSHAIQHMTTFSRLNVEDIIHRDHPISSVGHDKLHVTEHLHVSSLTYTFDKPINRNLFMEWLEQLPVSVYRIKGFLKFVDDVNSIALFQYAFGVPFFYREEVNLPLNLVMIGENLAKDLLKEQLNQLEQY